MKDCISIEARRFPVVAQDPISEEVTVDFIILTKQELQAAQLVGQSSKELITRIYQRKGFKVLSIGKAFKKTLEVNLKELWD